VPAPPPVAPLALLDELLEDDAAAPPAPVALDATEMDPSASLQPTSEISASKMHALTGRSYHPPAGRGSEANRGIAFQNLSTRPWVPR
jgi:hypothetical protein